MARETGASLSKDKCVRVSFVQRGLLTPTELNFGNCCTRGIHGVVFGSAFMQPSRSRTGQPDDICDRDNRIETHVTQPSSVPVDRRARRAKSRIGLGEGRRAPGQSQQRQVGKPTKAGYSISWLFASPQIGNGHPFGKGRPQTHIMLTDLINRSGDRRRP